MSSPLGQVVVELVVLASVIWPGCKIHERKTRDSTDALASPPQYSGVNKLERAGARTIN